MDTSIFSALRGHALLPLRGKTLRPPALCGAKRLAHIVDDRVQETTTTAGGTGALTLAGAAAKHSTFAAAGFADGDTFLGLIEHQSAAEYELSLCTWNTGGTVTRGVPRKSSAGVGVSVDFSTGIKTISVVAGANRDAMSVRTVTAGASYASVANDGVIIVDKTVGSATAITLKANPIVGDRQTVVDGKGDAGTNNITITAASGNINGAASVVINADRETIEFIRGESEWKILSVA